MATYTWLNSSGGAGGAFDLAANWSSGTVPAAGDTAVFASGGGPVSGTGAVDAIAFSMAAWSIAGQLTAATVTLENGTLTAGTNGGQLVATSLLRVGLSSNATLAAVNGGQIAVTGSASGPASQFGAATLTIANRGLILFGSGLSLGVNGLSTTALVNAAVMTVGGVLQLGSGGTSAGAASLTVVGGGQVVLSSATDTSTPYLKVGAVDGASGTLAVDGANSILLLSNNSGAVGYRGSGTMTVTGGGQARFNASANSSNNALNPALTIGRFGIGTVTVSGANSLVAAGGSVIVGTAGRGTLTVQNGGAVTAVGFTPTQAALAIGSGGGGSGAVIVTGPGSRLTASGAAILGGDDRGSGLVGGGTGTLTVNGGAVLQTGPMTVLAGSAVSVGGGSTAVVGGSLALGGTLFTAGTLVVGGAVYGGGQITVAGGITDFGSLGAAGVVGAAVTFASASATIRLRGLVGDNTVSAMQVGDEIDLVGNASVRLLGNVVTTTTGTLNLTAAPAGSHYALASDGAGGTSIGLNLNTIGVYRFFDSNYGTHFFSASGDEKATVSATRADLIYEGVGLQAVDPASADANAAPVYRFFDTSYGTHFFTASASERNTVQATRSDLLYEGTGFLEHTTQQAGDTAVYRFFDSNYGTHFYTADANERATIVATRPDLVDEGIGFYSPPDI